MSEINCPICYTPLEVRDVTPCWDCGGDPAERVHLADGRHHYAEFSVFNESIVLCDFCRVDFCSYEPTYFGQSAASRPGRELVLIRDVLFPQPTKDKYCPNCGRRLAFLRFLARVREYRPHA